MWLSPISPSISALGVSAATGINDKHIERLRLNKRSWAISRPCSPVVWLRDDQVLDIHAQLGGIGRIERMFGVDEGGHGRLASELRR